MNRKIAHYKRVMQAELELEKRVQATSTQTSKQLQWKLSGLLEFLSGSLLMGWALFAGIPRSSQVLILVFLSFSILCKCYGLIIGVFTIFSGTKLFFSGQYFAIAPVLPFTIVNSEVSYFFLGWGLLAASKTLRSHLSLLLGISYSVGGVLGLFQFRQSTYITAPGFGGSAVSSIFIIYLGYSMIKILLTSWWKPKAT